MFGLDDALLGSLAGGVLGFAGQQSANSANAAIAQSQMDFQERMANTTYQRGVKDLQAAGLNPMLAYMKGGAPAPSGASAVMGNSGAAAAQSAAQLGSMVSSNRLTNAQAEQQEHETMVDKFFGGPRSIERAREDIRKIQGEIEVQGGQTALMKAQTLSAYQSIDKALQDIETGKASADLMKVQARNVQVLIENSKLDQEQKKALNKMWSDVGEGGAIAKEFAPFIRMMIMMFTGRS